MLRVWPWQCADTYLRADSLWSAHDDRHAAPSISDAHNFERCLWRHGWGRVWVSVAFPWCAHCAQGAVASVLIACELVIIVTDSLTSCRLRWTELGFWKHVDSFFCSAPRTDSFQEWFRVTFWLQNHYRDPHRVQCGVQDTVEFMSSAIESKEAHDKQSRKLFRKQLFFRMTVTDKYVERREDSTTPWKRGN